MSKWTCPTCGEKVEISSQDDHPRIRHLLEHNPSPAQWATAYDIIQAHREKAKKVSAST